MQLFNVNALKLLTLPTNFSYRCPKNYGLAQIFSCYCPKNLNFAQILETRGAIAPPASPAGTATKFSNDENSRYT